MEPNPGLLRQALVDAADANIRQIKEALADARNARSLVEASLGGVVADEGRAYRDGVIADIDAASARLQRLLTEAEGCRHLIAFGRASAPARS